MSRLLVNSTSRMRSLAPNARNTILPPSGPILVLNRRRDFSTTPHRNIMNRMGFKRNELMVRDSIEALCAKFTNKYWQEHDQKEEYPAEFFAAIAKGGWLGIALPERLGGSGLGITEAVMMMQTIAESGAGMAGAQAIHGNIYATQPLAKFASKEQEYIISECIAGTHRICFGVTEPNTGLDTTRLRTVAEKKYADGTHTYSITGQKVWITCAQVARRMLCLARTTPLEKSKKPSKELSLFCITLKQDTAGCYVRKIKKMGGRAVDANEVFFNNYVVPGNSLIGEENRGFDMVLHGMNAERCLLAGEALGLGYAALKKAAYYAQERIVFDRPIGMNQGIAHPLAKAYMNLEAAKLATYQAARLYDKSKKDPTITQGQIGVLANTAKYLAAEAAFTACERAVLTLGGMGYAQEYDVERWLRESLVPRIAPVSQEMIMNYISEKVLGLPKSYDRYIPKPVDADAATDA
ncbi:acyl-CoA dehydrogenase/oxidase [Rostrohypoxylon terebratum]|nr:acyl-CoA dehydrogenase/oxidase [Rostrohypoxylon terebratum]